MYQFWFNTLITAPFLETVQDIILELLEGKDSADRELDKG